MKKARLKDELTIQRQVNEAMMATLNAKYAVIADQRAEILEAKAKAFDLLSESR